MPQQSNKKYEATGYSPDVGMNAVCLMSASMREHSTLVALVLAGQTHMTVYGIGLYRIVQVYCFPANARTGSSRKQNETDLECGKWVGTTRV